MWVIPSLTTSRRTASAPSWSAGGPNTWGPASCMAPYPTRVRIKSSASLNVPPGSIVDIAGFLLVFMFECVTVNLRALQWHVHPQLKVIRTGSWLFMRKNPLNKGIIMENAAGIGTVTSEMVETRARELAAINGRPSSEPSQADYQQAKRELTGEAETDPQEESSESVPDSDGWNPVPGSTGRQAADSLGEDEDPEGRSESAQMFEEGISEAEHDQMRQAARADEKSDEPER